MFRKLRYLTGMATVSVVIYHSTAWGFISMFWWAHRYRPVATVNFDQLGNIEYYGLRFIEQLVAFAIPAFIFLSGYFIAFATGKKYKTVGWDIVISRIRILIVPFIIWSIISLFSNMVLQGEKYTPLTFFILIVSGRAADLFYYIPLLVQLYLLSPLLVLLIKQRTKITLLVSGMIQVLVLFFRYIAILNPETNFFSSLSNSILFTSYIFWFVFGVYIEMNLPNIKKNLVHYKNLFTYAIPLLGVAGIIEWELLFRFSGQDWIAPRETLIDQLYALCIILVFIASEKIRFPLSEQIANLSASSYAIYLVHTLALVSTAKIVYHLVPSVMEYQILFQPILILGGLGVPLLLMYLVKRSFLQKYYGYLFG